MVSMIVGAVLPVPHTVHAFQKPVTCVSELKGAGQPLCERQPLRHLPSSNHKLLRILNLMESHPLSNHRTGPK